MEKIDYLVLLQGINVGGKNIVKMAELKKLFEKMKFTDVETYIQSGNVLFKDCENDKIKLTRRIERALLNEFKNEIKVKVLTFSEIIDVLNEIPNDFGKEINKYKYDILFLIEPLTVEQIAKEIKPIKNNDKIFEGKKAFYVKRNTEKLTGSYITQLLKISPNITVRNLNTTKKLYELMLERRDNIK
jgi:uncharacterized protein (DUF1697 family)